MDKEYRDCFWNSPFYKPQNKICEEAWDEFMHTARMLLILDTNRTKEERERSDFREIDVYAVFNKMRQDIHNELPYSKGFIDEIDKSVEREYQKEKNALKASRPIGYVSGRD